MYKSLENLLVDLNKRSCEEKIYSIIVSKKGSNDYIYEYSSINELHPIRSISKLIVALCIGKLFYSKEISCGLLNGIDSLVWPSLSKIVTLDNTQNLDFLKRITIKHLLSQTTGYGNKELLLSHTIKNIDSGLLLDYVINEPIISEPGDKFVYSNASAFLLSVLFQETTGQDLYSYAQKNIFAPLLICNHSWTYYGKYCAGCTGLSLSNHDMLKIGRLLMLDDNYNNVITMKYITDMLTPHTSIDTSYRKNPLRPYSYGYFMWICDNSIYYINGNGGQYIIISHKNQTIISMQANISNVYPILEKLIPILQSN